jgi:hypothetical protein
MNVLDSRCSVLTKLSLVSMFRGWPEICIWFDLEFVSGVPRMTWNLYLIWLGICIWCSADDLKFVPRTTWKVFQTCQHATSWYGQDKLPWPTCYLYCLCFHCNSGGGEIAPTVADLGKSLCHRFDAWPKVETDDWMIGLVDSNSNGVKI